MSNQYNDDEPATRKIDMDEELCDEIPLTFPQKVSFPCKMKTGQPLGRDSLCCLVHYTRCDSTTFKYNNFVDTQCGTFSTLFHSVVHCDCFKRLVHVAS
jgi:hypothetical protein